MEDDFNGRLEATLIDDDFNRRQMTDDHKRIFMWIIYYSVSPLLIFHKYLSSVKPLLSCYKFATEEQATLHSLLSVRSA